MLTIRPEQMNVLAAIELRKFEARVHARLAEFWPEECEAMGEEAVRELIMTGVERARLYDVVDEYDVLRYINIMMALGRDFDTDDRYPWAAAFLNEPAMPRPRMMDRLCERVSRELKTMNAGAEESDAGV